jgi:glucan phosphoethanolaminetransferase (alkaline phosphatase superfamily)
MSFDILTFNQGIILMIESGFFLIFYYIYHLVNGDKQVTISVLYTALIFSLWLLSVTVVTNITRALNFPLKITSM